jgi:phenylalanyl-tRNA synthetase alpha chain
VAFFVPPTWEENDFMELARECGGDLIENVKCIDEFTNPKSGKRSLCYRIVYRSMDRSLTNEEIDQIQFNLRDKVAPKLGVELR